MSHLPPHFFAGNKVAGLNWLGITAVALAIFSAPATIKGASLHIQGEYQFQGGLTSTGKYLREVSYPFELYIDGPKYAITTTDHNQETRICSTSDGVESYSLKELKVISGLPRDEAIINNGPFPRFADMAVQLVWFAFMSQELTTAKLDSPISRTSNFECYSTNGQSLDPSKTIYRLAPDADRLPESAIFWCRSEFTTRDGEIRHYLSPYNKGYKAGVYEVKEWYRESGLVLPKTAELTIFFTKRRGTDAGDTQFLSRYKITMTKVDSLVGDKNFSLISKVGATTVKDYRFDDNVPMLYGISNSQWRAKSTIKWSQEIKQEMIDHYNHVYQTKVMPGLPPPRSKIRLIVVALMMVVTALLPIVYWQKYRKETRTC